MFNTSYLQRIVITLAIATTFGILVHDTKIDKAVALAVPVAAITFGLGTHSFDHADNAHTHVERASISQQFSGIPRIQPRNDHKKFLLPKYLSRNTTFFGGNAILWPSV